MEVFKFGGASVKDAEAVKNVYLILRSSVKVPTVVVISAMGKITNKLEELTRAYFFKEKNAPDILDAVKDFHLDICRQLFADDKSQVYNEIENVFVELSWAIEEEPAFSYNHHYDQIVSQGEILS